MTRKKSTDELPTWSALGKALGRSRQLLEQTAVKPDAPKTKSVSAWLSYLGLSSETTTDERLRLRVEKQRQEVRKLTVANDATDQRIESRAQEIAAEVIDGIMDKLRVVLLGQLPGQIADALNGLDRTDREMTARRLIEEGMRRARG